MTLATYVLAVRDQLQGASPWSDAEIEDHVLAAIREFSQYIPYEQEAILPVVDSEKEVDQLVWLDDRVYIKAVEFPLDRSERRWRNWEEWGDHLTLGIDFKPVVSSQSYLTGTCTFTVGHNVTGVGTAFESELSAGDFIMHSSDENSKVGYAKVHSITSDTALTLLRNYLGTTGADALGNTFYRTYKEVVRIFWGGMHDVDTTTIPTKHEQLVIAGATAHTLMGFAKLGREKILEAATHLAVGEEYINKVTHGDNVPGGFAGYSGAELNAAALVLQYQAEGWARLNSFKAALRQHRTQRAFKVHSRGA